MLYSLKSPSPSFLFARLLHQHDRVGRRAEVVADASPVDSSRHRRRHEIVEEEHGCQRPQDGEHPPRSDDLMTRLWQQLERRDQPYQTCYRAEGIDRNKSECGQWSGIEDRSCDSTEEPGDEEEAGDETGSPDSRTIDSRDNQLSRCEFEEPSRRRIIV